MVTSMRPEPRQEPSEEPGNQFCYLRRGARKYTAQWNLKYTS